jgi:4-hydroxybutyrate CoA-transferase
MMNYLKNHKNLGIHTEMFSDGLMELVKCGAVNNSLKSLVPHKSVTSFISGSKQLYDFVDDNPGIYVDDAGFTNSPFNIAKNDNVIAVNTAIEVDITGQVCADSVGTYMVSGVGGQLDFEYGAALSKGGMPIICLPSLSSKISESTIVPSLRPGAGVTTTRYHAHWIVTEYG